MAKDIHKKHRERVRNSFLSDGFTEHTPEHKILEMLLFYSIPRKDTNEIAHILLNRFGTLTQVIDAKPSELKKIDGIGDNSVALIKLISHLVRHYGSRKFLERNNGVLSSDTKIFNFILNKHMSYTEEVFAVTSLSANGKFLGFDVVNHGDVSSVGVSTREILEIVMKRDAVNVVISHNHPNGSALPSKSDIDMTEKIKRALMTVDINLYDHIIVANGDGISFRQSANLKYNIE